MKNLNKRTFIIIFIIICMIFSIKSYAMEIENITNNVKEGSDSNTSIDTPPDNQETPQEPPPENEENPQEPPEDQEEPPQNNVPEDSTTVEPPIEQEEPTTQAPETDSSSQQQEDTYIYVEEKSSNNYLQSLEINGFVLEPEFSADITEYYLVVDLSIYELEIVARPDDENASVNIYRKFRIN